jgi:hypothetical protein
MHLIALELIKKLPIYLKKFWVWVKSNGHIVFVISIAVIVSILSRRSLNIKKLLDEKKENYQSQIDAIDAAHEEEIRKREQALERYNKVISQVEKEFEESSGALDRKKRDRVKKIVADNAEDPEAITKALSETLGVSIHVD